MGIFNMYDKLKRKIPNCISVLLVLNIGCGFERLSKNGRYANRQQKRSDYAATPSFQLLLTLTYAFSIYETIHAPTSFVPYFAPPSTWISGVRTLASSEASTALRINAPSSFKSKYSNNIATERI